MTAADDKFCNMVLDFHGKHDISCKLYASIRKHQVLFGFLKKGQTPKKFYLFDLILYVPSTIFQLYRDGSSWVEPVLS